MRLRAAIGSTFLQLGLAMAFGLASAGLLASPGPLSPRFQTTCFAVAGNVACIDAAVVPIMPGASPATGAAGPVFDGQSEDTVIRDNGGHEVARG